MFILNCHFEASEDIVTKFKSQALHDIKSNTEKLVGETVLPPSFLPSRPYAFYFINRPSWPNILSPSVHVDYEWSLSKETKGRSSGQTPFTLKPKQLALKKPVFNTLKILPKLKKKKKYQATF
jgi:hypothetical protein